MRVKELIQYLKYVPQDAFVYLDDTKMPTPLGLVKVEYDSCIGFQMGVNREDDKQIQIGVVTLKTYK